MALKNQFLFGAAVSAGAFPALSPHALGAPSPLRFDWSKGARLLLAMRKWRWFGPAN